MIPILFDGKATSFSSNGIGRLKETIDCRVTRKAEGDYVLVMKYPIDGAFFNDIDTTKKIVVDTHKYQRQAFDVYKIEKPINGICTIYANHVSYGQSYIPIAPFQAQGITRTLEGLNSNVLEDNPYTFTTDLTNETSNFVINTPTSLRRCLGGMKGSITDIFSGSSGIELEWDNYNTFITLNAGKDNGVTLRFRKNITDLKQTLDIEDTITGVLPMWSSEDGNINVYGEIQYSPNADKYPSHRTVVLDLSDEFATPPSLADLNLAGQIYVNRASVGLAKNNIKLSFIDLAKVDSPYSPLLETLDVFDTVHVIYEPLNIEFDSKVISSVWDVLLEKYDEVEIGDVKNNLAQTITDSVNEIAGDVVNTRLVGVTQYVDREIGEVVSSVTEISGVIYGTDEIEGLQEQVQTNTTNIRQNAENIALKASNTTVDNISGRVTTLETNVVITSEGLQLRENTDGSYIVLRDYGLEIYVNNMIKAKATAEGFVAPTFIADTWHMQPMNYSKTFSIFRKE